MKSENRLNKYSIKNKVFLLFIIDLIILNIAYFGIHYYKRGTLTLEPDYYFKLLILFYCIWLIISLVMGKFKPFSYPSFKKSVLLIAKSNSIIIYILALTVVLMGLFAFSRIQIFGTCLLLFTLELVTYTGYYHCFGKEKLRVKEKNPKNEVGQGNFSISFILYDSLLLGLAFFLLNYYKRGQFTLTTQYEDLLFVIYGVWIVSSAITRKFERKPFRNYYHAIAPIVKSYLISLGITAVTVFAFRLFFYSRLHIFGTFTIFLVLELIAYYFYFITGLEKKNGGDVETIDEVHQSLEQEYLQFEVDIINTLKQEGIKPALAKLKDKFLRRFPTVFDFILQNIDLNRIDEKEAVVLRTHTMYNVETLDDHASSLFINLHKVNDVRYLNRYFLEVHKKIYNGGYFVGCGETLATRKKRFYQKYSWNIAQILYPFHFVIFRIVPKIPGLKQFYFFITRGRNRAISQGEILGRLCFCGFRIIATQEIDNHLYFIAQRAKTPSADRNPSYGPVIKLRRIGYNREIIYVNKFRTMHPYSEYLQDYVYDMHGTKNGDKFLDDFRVTGWGKFMRRFWIDEIPMIINYFRGDLKIVGVRPLSLHKFSIYSSLLQEKRIKYKPGLIPPFYADLPNDLEGVMNSEINYLDKYANHPIRTDIEIFFLAWYNILFKRARSQ